MDRNQLLTLLPTNSVGAELGVCDGEYSEIILNTVDPKRLYLIDVWRHIDLGYPDGLMTNDNKQAARYRRVLAKFLNNDRVRVIRDYTTALVEILPPAELDWIYIDADHSFRGCWKDLEIADTLVHNDGYILGHDYNAAENYGVIEAVDRFVAEKGYVLSLITTERARSYCISKTAQADAVLKQRMAEQGLSLHG